MLNNDISNIIYNKLINIKLQPNSKIILSISGGVDSMVLLDILKNNNIDLRLHILHLNFNKHINAKNSELLIKTIAQAHNIEFKIINI